MIRRVGATRLIIDFYSEAFADDFEEKLRRVYDEKKQKAIAKTKKRMENLPKSLKKSVWAHRRKDFGF